MTHWQLVEVAGAGLAICQVSGKAGWDVVARMHEVELAFGGVLKSFRENRQVSQSKLAKRAGFDHSYVSRLESGARTPTREAVEQLASALELDGVQYDELLVSAGFLPREVSSLLAGEPEITEVLGLLQNADVPEEYRTSMRQVLRVLADQARLVLRGDRASGSSFAA